MTENWIKEIAESIKEKNRDAALQTQENAKTAEIIRTRGRGFYEETCSLIEAYAQAMMSSDVMKNDPTRGEFNVQRVHDNFTFFRQAFPFLSGNIVFQEPLAFIQVTFAGSNPFESTGKASEMATYKLLVGENESVYATEAYGQLAQKFDTPASLAQHVFKQMMAV